MTIRTDFVNNVGMTVDADYLNALGTAVNANSDTRTDSGTYAALPAPGTSGRFYLATDVGLVFRDNGTSWDVVGGNGQPPFALPPTSGWTDTTLGTATVAADKGGRLFTMPASNTTPRLEYQTLSPASGYTLICRQDMTVMNLAGLSHMGIFVRDSTSGNSIFIGVRFGASGSVIDVCQNTAAAMESTNLAFKYVSDTPRGVPVWFRIRDDGTRRYYGYSWEGIDFVDLYDETRTTYITPDQVAWGGANNANTKTNYLRLRSWELTTP